MKIKLLKNKHIKFLEEFISCRTYPFIFNYYNGGGLEYKGKDFQGEYYGFFSDSDQLEGIIIHYWNNDLILHTFDNIILDLLIDYLKINLYRPIEAIIGSYKQVTQVIKKLGLSSIDLSFYNNIALYEIDLKTINTFDIPNNFEVINIEEVSKNLILSWLHDYYHEDLLPYYDYDREKEISKDVQQLHKKKDCWLLQYEGTNVSLCALRAKSKNMIKIGPVWTPLEYRNNGFAKLLLKYILSQEKSNGIRKAILLTYNTIAMRVYQSIGFSKTGDYYIAVLKNPFDLLID